MPDVHVQAALVDPDGRNLGTYRAPLLWHGMIYHYARNWNVRTHGDYTLRIHVDPPTFMRHH